MHAFVTLNNNENVRITRLKLVREFNPTTTSHVDIVDFNNFALRKSFSYSFIGDEILAIKGDDIAYVKFEP